MHTHTNRESRLAYFGPENMNILPSLPGILHGAAELSASEQPTNVARVIADTTKEMQQTKNQHERFLVGVNLLYKVYYPEPPPQADQSTEQAAPSQPTPEALLGQLVKALTVKAVSAEFEHQLETAMSTGDARALQITSQKLGLVQKLIENAAIQARGMNQAYPVSRLKIPGMTGASFAPDDRLAIVLHNVSDDGATEFGQMDGASRLPDGSAVASRNRKALRCSKAAGSHNIAPYEGASLTGPDADHMNNLNKRVFNTMMEIQTIKQINGPYGSDAEFALKHELDDLIQERQALQTGTLAKYKEAQQRHIYYDEHGNRQRSS